MSMCKVAYKFRNEGGVAYVHYAQAILDWKKYHQYYAEWYRESGPIDASEIWTKYHVDNLAFHERCANGFEDDINRDGCERDAGKNNFWIVDTEEAATAWCEHAKKYQLYAYSFDSPPSDVVCYIDFDAKIMTVYYDKLCDWWNFLPEEWTFVIMV